MIQYSLKCNQDHVFDAWFRNSKDADDQLDSNLVECPHCGNSSVKKALMAPAVHGTKFKPDPLKSFIDSNFVNVGENFANEARAMYYGDTEARDIHGTLSYQEAVDLVDEGINFHLLPEDTTPQKKDIN